MADLPPFSDANGDTSDDTDVGPDRGSTTSTPRWVYVFGIILIVLVLLFVIMQLTGEHGPGRHIASIHELHGDAPSGEVGDHRPPEGGH